MNTRICILLLAALLAACNKPGGKKSNAQDSISNQKSTLVGLSPYDCNGVIDTLTLEGRIRAQNHYSGQLELDFARTHIAVDTSECHVYTKVCAVSVIPDTTWLGQQQRSMSEDSWNAVVDDQQYYEQMAIDTLNKLKIPDEFSSREKRYIMFVKFDKTEFIIDLCKIKDAWGLILFNGVDNPILWGGTDISKQLKDIYHK